MISERGGVIISCIVADQSLGWAIKVAAKFGIRHAAIFPAAAASMVLGCSILKLVDDGLIDPNVIEKINMAIPSITSLPEDIIIDCVARVPRRYYPTLSMVSKLFRSLIASPELYKRRSLLDRTECRLYVTMSTYEDGNRLYTLTKKSSNYCLVPITSLPPMPTSCSYVAVDSKIFVMGGSCNMNNSYSSYSTNVLLIDCQSHKARHDLPSMPMKVGNPFSTFENGKIYVLGNYSTISDWEMGVMVFDIKTATWESKTRPDMTAWDWFSSSSVIWDHKVYIKTCSDSFVYDLNEDKLEKDDVLNTQPWYGSNCVLDGVLYFCCSYSGMLHGYDLKERCWITVKNVERLFSNNYVWSSMVMLDGKVLLFFRSGEEIWCEVIKVERDEQGEVLASIEWYGCVFKGYPCNIHNCLVVKV